MNTSIGKWLPVVAAAFVAAAFVIASDVEAARGVGGGGGGRGGGGGGARSAGGGGGQRQAPQVNNSRADARTNDVRSGSVNNVNNVNVNRNDVNVNRNVNVNVDNGWDRVDHPVAAAAVVGAAIAVTSAAIGSMVATVPAGCVPVNYGGMVYQQCDGTWYQPQGTQFVVVNPPY
jgi:hypothetical protein